MLNCLQCNKSFKVTSKYWQTKQAKKQKYCSIKCSKSYWNRKHRQQFKEFYRLKAMERHKKRMMDPVKHEKYNAYQREYYRKFLSKKEGYISKVNERSRERHRQRRLKALNILSKNNPKCAYCGCNEKAFLEINHTNGDGSLRRKTGLKTGDFVREILEGKTEGYDIACRVCNGWHWLSLKFGKEQLKWEIKWLG